MKPLLIIGGPTATGKTSLALEVAKKINGEIVSADSRQVYIGMDIVTGKDLPPQSKFQISNLKWRDRFLKYYLLKGINIWLYDIVYPDEPFNVSFWNECANLVITDILSRNKLPIIVGGTGLYLKSIIQPLSQISIPPNQSLRDNLKGKSVAQLFNYLNRIDSHKAAELNTSDRKNPRRLIRAIEILIHNSPSLRLREGHKGGELFNNLSICLSAPKDYLNSRIDQRVEERVANGAVEEAKKLLDKYSPDLPSMTSSGYRAFLHQEPINKWKTLEHQYARRQLTWFKKQTNVNWFDVSVPNWSPMAVSLISNWYNN